MKRYFIERCDFQEIAANDIVSSLFVLYSNIGRLIGIYYGGFTIQYFGINFSCICLIIISFISFIYLYYFTDDDLIPFENAKKNLKQNSHLKETNNLAKHVDSAEHLLVKGIPKKARRKKYVTTLTICTLEDFRDSHSINNFDLFFQKVTHRAEDEKKEVQDSRILTDGNNKKNNKITKDFD